MPSLRVDHVLLAVADLGEAAAHLGTYPGLTAFEGGRHPGVGTANMIIPFGRDYLELIAVVDEAEAASSVRSSRVREAVESGRTFAGWAVRTDDIERLRTQLEEIGTAPGDVLDGTRVRPDGVRLTWRTLTLATPGPADPFFIEWLVAPAAHPGALPAAHRCRATGIRSLTAGGGGPLIEMLQRAGLPVTVAGGEEPGLLSLELETLTGPLVLR